MIKELRKLGLEEAEAYHKSVFQIPINKFDVIKEILSIVRIMLYSKADKQKLRDCIKVLNKNIVNSKNKKANLSEKDRGRL
ncbi:MAG: hypothetical protein QW745_05555 [Thermoplasmata archaeon]